MWTPLLLSSFFLPLHSAVPPLPFWSAPPLDSRKPLAGLPQLPNVTNSILFYGSAAQGDYNHGAMLAYHEGAVTVAWKNGEGTLPEDAPGQRVRYTQTTDGRSWTPPALLFPSLSTAELPTALFAGPFAVLNGRLYASATPGLVQHGDAQGSQFCLWPDGLDARNAGPPQQPQPVGVLLLRRILDARGGLGPLFWAANATPAGFAHISVSAGILTANQTDALTQSDVFSPGFSAAMPALPCGDPATSGTLKCEACLHGCQDFERLTSSPAGLAIANERSHWTVPLATPQWGGADVLVYRSKANALLAAVRPAGQRAWGSDVATLTSFPNDNSNINAGAVAAEGGGGVFLVSNALPKSTRDPLVLALSQDGFNFSRAFAIASCTALPGLNSTCTGRHGANGNGPSYPQALTVVAPAPAELQGMWVVSTNCKEDVLLSRFPHSALLASPQPPA